MCNKTALRYAKELYRMQHVRDYTMFGHIWQVYKDENPEDRNTSQLCHAYGLVHRMEERRKARRDFEFDNILNAVNIDGFGYVVTKENLDGTARVTRRYTDMFTATAIREAWLNEQQPYASAYSPTGQWFTASLHVRKLRPNVWVVITTRMLDC